MLDLIKLELSVNTKLKRNAFFFFSFMVLELTTLKFLVIWNSSFASLSSLYFFFLDNQQININIKISNFFHLNAQTYVFIYLNGNIIKYINFNFKILIFRPLISVVHSFLTHSSISNFLEALWLNWLKYWRLE